MNETKNFDKNEKSLKTQKVFSILIIIALALMVPVIIVNCTLIFKQLTTPDVPPSIFGLMPQYIGDDMDNLGIKKGDMILIKKVDADDIEAGDVIFFKTLSGKYILQEVDTVVLDETGAVKAWYTKEPNLTFGLNIVYPSQLLGEYNGARFWGVGAVATFSQTVPGVIVCMAIPIGLLVAYEIVCVKKKSKATEDDKAQLLAELEALRKAKAEKDAKEAQEAIDAPASESDRVPDPESQAPMEVEAPSEEINEIPEENGEDTAE